MWQPFTVERILFKWKKWRNSIIKEWIEGDNLLNNTSIQLESLAENRIKEVGFPDIFLLKLYWICCVSSEYNIDYPTTFEKIIIPANFNMKNYQVTPGVRIYPPGFIDQADVEYEASHYGFPIKTLTDLYSSPFSERVIIQPDHELIDMLKVTRGRPKKHIKRGRIPYYSDRLAVRCAFAKNSGLSNVKIAKDFHLRVTKPYSSRQSDVVVNLVKRGKKLIEELSPY